jgi:hypothetical protein
MVFINVLYLPVISLLSSKPTISHREHFSVWLVCVYTCITVIDKVLLRKERSKTKRCRLGNINIRQCSISVVNFWSVTYFGVFNFGTSNLGAKIGQNKTMTKISRFTVLACTWLNNIFKRLEHESMNSRQFLDQPQSTVMQYQTSPAKCTM